MTQASMPENILQVGEARLEAWGLLIPCRWWGNPPLNGLDSTR
jgi:hypothetical protein